MSDPTTNAHHEPRRFERYKVEWLPLVDLAPHPRIQRAFRQKWANTLLETFDPDKCTPLLVVMRSTKALVFDGQHRLWALRKWLGNDQRVPCHIYEELSLAQQAEICLGINDTRAWSRLDRWRQEVLAERATPLQITEVLDRRGLAVGKGAGANTVRAITSMEQVVHQIGLEGLDRVLSIQQRAYRDDKDAFDGQIMLGLGMVLSLIGDQIRDPALVERLAKHGGPQRLIGDTRDYAKGSGFSMKRAMAERLVTLYNRGRRTGAVELRAKVATAKKPKPGPEAEFRAAAI